MREARPGVNEDLPEQLHHHGWCERLVHRHHLAEELKKGTHLDGMGARWEEQDIQQLDVAPEQLSHPMIGGGALPWIRLQGLHI